MTGVTLDRDGLISALRDLVLELDAAGEVAGIRLVGGAALALRYFDRRSTSDIDSLHVKPGTDAAVMAAAARVAEKRGWDAGWFNFRVEDADALPALGRQVEWETIYRGANVLIEVASKEALLAMKLRANRPGRDTDDIRQLLALCEIQSVGDAESLYEDFYPGDSLTDRALSMVERILGAGLPVPPTSPGQILDLTPPGESASVLPPATVSGSSIAGIRLKCRVR